MSHKTSLPPNPAANVCVVYCRVSSDAQAKEKKGSLDDQEQAGILKAKELGLRVLYVVKDPESAWILDKRTKFRSVLDDAKAGKFSVMIIDRMNRFIRGEDLGDYMQVKTELRLAGVTPVFVAKDYPNTPTGQLMQMIDAYVSAQEQANRRAQVLVGLRTRVHRDHHPVPGRVAPYGFVWVPDTNKTWLMRDPGDAQAVMLRIWNYFLHFQPDPGHKRPSLRGIERKLSDAHIPPPRVYQGIENKKGTMRAMGWCRQSITDMLKDPRYWGEPRPALRDSKHRGEQPPVEIPAYVRPGEEYVTPQEAARVHAMLGWNDKHAGRPPKRDWGMLLNGGLAACAYCGKRLDLSPSGGQPRKDGTYLLHYRCSTRDAHGPDPAKGGCPGATIQANVLDWATIDALDSNLKKEHFLENIFAAWERDEGEAGDAVRIAKAALDQAESDLANLAVYAARTPPNTVAGGALQFQFNQLNEVVPGLRQRHLNALAARDKVRANTALADELRLWFDAWLEGFYGLPTEQRRQFLESLHAKVMLWQEGDPARAGLPRAELVIGLPTDVLHLPTPWSSAELAWLNVTVAPDGWHVPLDIATAAQTEQAIAGGFTFDNEATPEEAAELDELRHAWQNADAAHIMQAVRDELRGEPRELAVPPPKAATTP